MKQFFLTILLVLFASATACDVIVGDPRENGVAPPPDTSGTRNVLLEDFTGQLCGNCPAAAEEAYRLEARHGSDRLVVLAIHVGSLASPSPPNYPREFRTPTGNDIDNLFRVSPVGIPQGMVNRIERSGRRVHTRGQWANLVQEQLRTKAVVEIEATATYDSSSRQITVDADVLYKQRGTSDYRLVAVLAENNIVGYQKDYRKTPSDVENTPFTHMLRTALTSTWGEGLSDYDVPANQSVKRTIRFTVPDDADWLIENCDVILYVHRHNSTREVLQVVKIKPVLQGS